MNVAHTRTVIAGGGTGGHLMGGLAVARLLAAASGAASVLFIGTPRGLENQLAPQAGFRLETIAVQPLFGRPASEKFSALVTLPHALWQARRLLAAFRPDVVLGVGGYASGPVVLAAWLAGLPTALIEQNSIPGRTNRLLGRLVRESYIAFAQAAEFFPPARSFLTGIPLRAGFEPRDPEELGAPRPLRLLVMGGSQGARAVDQFARQAVALLVERGVALEVHHQCRGEALAELTAAYRKLGLAARVEAFISDVGAALRWADVALCRAGAGTVAELCAVGVPAILVPFPFAIDNHQEFNAREVVRAGGAVLLRESEADGAQAAEVLTRLAGERRQLVEMARRTATLGRPRAAAAVVERLQALAAQNKQRSA